MEIGEDDVLLDVFDESTGLHGNSARYAITPDTLIWYEAPFKAGSGCE